MEERVEHERPTTLQSMTAEDFVRRLRAYTIGDSPEAKYAFFIGAGCSVTSGIPGARTLIRDRWIPRLRDIRAPGQVNPLEWAKREYGIDTDDLPADAYGRIMTDLFPSPALRQAEVESLCALGRPGFGYATLAQLMAESKSHFNVVLTTNFDDLVADALYLFTGDHPLLIHHGALSPFIRATRTRPMIVKLHGHHQFLPLNTQEETQRIESGIASGVRSSLHDRGLIFIGYSGNDDGIRDLLAELSTEALPYGVFWVGGSEPIGPIRGWLDERRAFWVRHHGFDELMVHIRDVFDLPMPSMKRVLDVFEAVQRDYISISERIHDRPADDPGEIALRDAAERVDRTVSDWAVYELRAQRFKEQDPERAKTTYEEGLRALPDSVPLHGNFANYLKDLGELDEAEKHYCQALELDPEYPNVLHDYAIFLWRYRGDENKAGAFVDRALAVDPGVDAVRLSNYANFAWEVRKDVEDAEQLFRRSVSLATFSPQPFMQYALFAQNERRNYGLANRLYQEALHRKPNDAVTLVNYASLVAVLGDLETARKSIQRAYAVDDDDITVVGLAAIFFKQHRIDPNYAQSLFDKARSKSPRGIRETRFYTFMISEYAWFLAEERDDAAQGMELLSQARVMFPDDLDLVSNTASYMAHNMGQPEEALKLLDETLTANGEHGSLLAVKAEVTSHFRGDNEIARGLYRRALALDPNLLNAKVNLAGILFASGESKEALPLCLDVLHIVGRAFPVLTVECSFYLFAHGPEDERPRALRMLKWLLTENVRSPRSNLKANVDRAVMDGHPDAEWLSQLADVIAGGKDITILSDWVEWRESQPPSND